MILEI